jgi:thioredoxin reductase
MKKYDLIVVGGGFAGFGAAVAAAREGVKTLLIERTNALSGAANTGLVMPFMPYRSTISCIDTDFLISSVVMA